MLWEISDKAVVAVTNHMAEEQALKR